MKALPTYQLWRGDEKLEEMTGALPAKLVAMIKTHHVKEKKGGWATWWPLWDRSCLACSVC